MKRDWDLLRKQLIDIEEENDVFADAPVVPKWIDQTQDEYSHQLKEFHASENRIFGHMEMLIENGYVDGIKISRGLDGHFSVGVFSPRLTMAGHDLLDTMRSTTIWNSIKSSAKSKGIELTFEAVKMLGAAALKHLLGA